MKALEDIRALPFSVTAGIDSYAPITKSMDRLKPGLPCPMPPLHTSSNTLSWEGNRVSSRLPRLSMPAEWKRTTHLLAWPHNRGDWPGGSSDPWCTRRSFAICPHERVELVVENASAEKQVREFLDRAQALSSHVRFHRWPTKPI